MLIEPIDITPFLDPQRMIDFEMTEEKQKSDISLM